MKLNLKDVQAGNGNFKEIESGRYNVKIDKAELGKTLDGKDTIRLTYRIMDGPFERSIFFDQAVITPQSLWKVKTLLNIVGSSLVDNSSVELNEIVSDLQNKDLSVYVEVESYINDAGQKKPRYQCNGWKPVEQTGNITPSSTSKTEKNVFGL